MIKPFKYKQPLGLISTNIAEAKYQAYVTGFEYIEMTFNGIDLWFSINSRIEDIHFIYSLKREIRLLTEEVEALKDISKFNLK